MDNQPSFHDGFVDGMVTFDSVVRVFLRTELGEKFTLVLHDVENLVVTRLRQGNIILSIDFLEAEGLDVSHFRDFHQLSNEQVKDTDINIWRAKMQEKNLRAVEIAPSYGATLVALFRQHEFIRGYSL